MKIRVLAIALVAFLAGGATLYAATNEVRGPQREVVPAIEVSTERGAPAAQDDAAARERPREGERGAAQRNDVTSTAQPATPAPTRTQRRSSGGSDDSSSRNRRRNRGRDHSGEDEQRQATPTPAPPPPTRTFADDDDDDDDNSGPGGGGGGGDHSGGDDD